MTRSPARLTASAGIRSRRVGNCGPSPLLKLTAGGLRCVFLPLPPAAACGECSPATAERETDRTVNLWRVRSADGRSHERSISRVHRSPAL